MHNLLVVSARSAQVTRASASDCWEWLCTHQPGPSLASAVITQVSGAWLGASTACWLDQHPAAGVHLGMLLFTPLQTLDGGRKRSGVFAIDLTLDQVKELCAVQTFRFRDHSYDARYRCAHPPVSAAHGIWCSVEHACGQAGMCTESMHAEHGVLQTCSHALRLAVVPSCPCALH